MNTITRYATLILFTLLSTGLFAQNSKRTELANSMIEKINSKIVSVDKTLALSDDQKTEINELLIERIQLYSDLNKSEKDEEKRKEAQKAILKKYNQKIYGEILSKKQLIAHREAKKN